SGFAGAPSLFPFQLPAAALRFALGLALGTNCLLLRGSPLTGRFLLGRGLLSGSFGGCLFRRGAGFCRCSRRGRFFSLRLQSFLCAVTVEKSVILGPDRISLDQDSALLAGERPHPGARRLDQRPLDRRRGAVR